MKHQAEAEFAVGVEFSGTGTEFARCDIALAVAGSQKDVLATTSLQHAFDSKRSTNPILFS